MKNCLTRTNCFRLLLGLLVVAPTSARAQQLSLKREPPTVAWAGCPARERPAPSSSAQREEAEKLAESATQAALLGDKAAAADHLTRAAAADPSSVPIAYRLARALDELDRAKDALAAYCRYLSLAPDGADATEARERSRVLGATSPSAVPAQAARAWEEGIAHFDAGNMAAAETSFSQANEAAKEWGAAIYNRGVVRLTQGRGDAAAEDFRRFLEVSPGAPEFNAVLDALTALRRSTLPYQPSRVLLTGLAVPGLGQFTTGRARAGAIVLGVTAGSLAIGFGMKELAVDCLVIPVNGQCPPAQVVGEKQKRPYLAPGIAVALAAWVYGAFDAYRGANRLNTEAVRSGRVGQDDDAHGLSLELPTVNVGLRGAQFDLLRLRF